MPTSDTSKNDADMMDSTDDIHVAVDLSTSEIDNIGSTPGSDDAVISVVINPVQQSGGSGSTDGAINPGVTYIDIATIQLNSKSVRYNASTNLGNPWNHRYRGNRESFKFNLLHQRILQLVAHMTVMLRTSDDALKAIESDPYPTDTEVALIYHIDTQIRFREYMYLRDSDRRWFV